MKVSSILLTFFVGTTAFAKNFSGTITTLPIMNNPATQGLYPHLVGGLSGTILAGPVGRQRPMQRTFFVNTQTEEVKSRKTLFMHLGCMDMT